MQKIKQKPNMILLGGVVLLAIAILISFLQFSYDNNYKKNSFYNDVVERIALGTKDAGFCGNLREPICFIGENCGSLSSKSNCVLEVESKINLDSECRDVPPGIDRDICLSSLAFHSGNAKYCDLMDDFGRKKTCRIDVNPTDDNCIQIDNVDERFSCIGQVTKNTNDSSYCDLLGVPGEREKCVSDLAAKISNPDLCNDLEIGKENCYAGAYIGSQCDAITNNTKRAYCYIRTAVKKNDVRNCAKLEGDCTENSITCKDLCYIYHASSLNNSFSCLKVSNSEYRDQCLLQIKNNFGSTQCKKIENPLDRDACLTMDAADHTDPSLCDGVKDIDFFSLCRKASQ